jgi:hypothetical protein
MGAMAFRPGAGAMALVSEISDVSLRGAPGTMSKVLVDAGLGEGHRSFRFLNNPIHILIYSWWLGLWLLRHHLAQAALCSHF